MNRDQIQDFLQLFALAGVIASLVFVGYEIKLSRQIALAEIAQQRANADIAMTLRPLKYEELRTAFSVARESLESITDRQRGTVEMHLDAQLIQFETVHYQYNLGLIDEDQMAVQRKLIGEVLNYPIERAEWETYKKMQFWTPLFIDEVDRILSELD